MWRRGESWRRVNSVGGRVKCDGVKTLCPKVASKLIGKTPSVALDYAAGKEHHHLILGMLGENKGKVKRVRIREREVQDRLKKFFLEFQSGD